jgi:ketopantoate reductase
MRVIVVGPGAVVTTAAESLHKAQAPPSLLLSQALSGGRAP